MRRILVFVILFFIAAGLVYPYIKGLVLRHEIKQSVEKFNNRLTDSVTSGSIRSITINHYETRYAESDIEWVVKTQCLNPWFDINDIILLDRMTHTFSNKVVSQTSFEKNLPYQKWVDQYLNGKDPLNITTEYFLSGDIKSFVTMDEFIIKNGTDTFHVKSGKVQFEFYKDLEQVVLNLSWNGIKMPGILRIDPLQITCQMKKANGKIWEGTAQFGVNGFTLFSLENPLALKELTGEYRSVVDENLSMVSIDLSAAIHSWASKMWNFSSGRGKLMLHNLDADGVVQFIRLYRDSRTDFLRQAFLLDMDSPAMERMVKQEITKLGAHFMDVYEMFLRKGLKIHLKEFHVTVPEGDIRADVRLALKKSMTRSGFLPVLLKPTRALDIFSLKSDIGMPDNLVKDPTMLTSPPFGQMKSGLFVFKENRLEHQAEIRDNGLWLNNNAVELP